MKKVIEQLLENKTLNHQRAFLHALSNHTIFLASVNQAAINQHDNTPVQDVTFFVEKDSTGLEYLLGFSDQLSFENWLKHSGTAKDNIYLTPVGFEELCFLMAGLQETETALILNPESDNLILANALFDDPKSFITDGYQVNNNQSYVAMSPLEEGDFSYELLQLLDREFSKEHRIDSVWAATIEIDGIESFLLIIASNNSVNIDEFNNHDNSLYLRLLDICKPFLEKNNLKILSSKTEPFDKAILNFDPIFARKPG